MKTLNDKKSSCSAPVQAFAWTDRIFCVADVSLPDAWFSIWKEFAIWLLLDPVFGARKFARSCHRPLIEAIAELAQKPYSVKREWSLAAAAARLAVNMELACDQDEECVASIAAAYAFVMAVKTGKKAWAARSLAALAHARASGWSAYAKAFSIELIYGQTRSATFLAQKAELSRLSASYGISTQKCAA